MIIQKEILSLLKQVERERESERERERESNVRTVPYLAGASLFV